MELWFVLLIYYWVTSLNIFILYYHFKEFWYTELHFTHLGTVRTSINICSFRLSFIIFKQHLPVVNYDQNYRSLSSNQALSMSQIVQIFAHSLAHDTRKYNLCEKKRLIYLYHNVLQFNIFVIYCDICKLKIGTVVVAIVWELDL